MEATFSPPVVAAPAAVGAFVERRFHLATARGRGGGSRRTLRRGVAPPECPPAPSPVPVPVHPLARRMAMAIRCQQLLDAGVVRDQAALAAVAGMTRAWITLVMRLTLLAPGIQEALLNLGAEEVVDHRAVQRIAQVVSWRVQVQRWRVLRASASRSPLHAQHGAGSL